MNKNNKNLAVINMAFGTGSGSKEGVGFDKYTGLAPFFILAVNPTMDGMKALFPDRNYTKEFSYSYDKAGEAKGTFVTFIIKTNVEHKDSNGIDFSSRATYLIKDEIDMNKDKTKVRVINDYGDTVWVTQEQFKSKELPDYAVKQAYITTGMRPAYVGEANLVEFLKTFINIPNSRNYSKETGWSPKEGEELSNALAGFSVEEIRAIANGNVAAVANAVKHQPDNQVKFLVGVRTTSDNKEYNEVLSSMPIRFGQTDYKKVDVNLQKIKEGGSLADTNFGVYPFKFQKYEVAMTNFNQSNNGPALPPNQDPFADFQS